MGVDKARKGISRPLTAVLLVVAGCLVVLVLKTGARTRDADTDCLGNPAPSRVVAMSLAGTSDRVAMVAQACNAGTSPAEQRATDREALNQDWRMIASYGSLLAILAAIGGRLSARTLTRQIGRNVVIAVVVAAVVLDGLVENEGLRRYVITDTESAGEFVVGVVTAASVTKFLVLAIACVYGLASVALAVRHIFTCREPPAGAPSGGLPGRLEWEERKRDPDENGLVQPADPAAVQLARFEHPRQRTTPEQLEAERTGVCFSGGGIRSASFAIGAIRYMQTNDLIRHVDYVTTVSGGGYAAMARQIVDCDRGGPLRHRSSTLTTSNLPTSPTYAGTHGTCGLLLASPATSPPSWLQSPP